MSKIETFGHMNGASKPFGEVGIAYLSMAFVILVDHDFLEVTIVDILVSSEILKQVLHGYVPIIICIKSQESFPYRVETVAKFSL